MEPVKETELEPEPEIEIIFEDKKLEHLKRFCVFTVMFYIPYFLTANIRADAAVNDLILFKKLKKFQQVTSCWLRKLSPLSPAPSGSQPQHYPVLPCQ